MYRFVLLALMLALPLLAAPLSNRVVIMVVMEDPQKLDAVSDMVKNARDENGFTEAQVPIVFARANQLTARDYSILGFSRQSLPVIALVRMSGYGNPEKVMGSPPIIMRQVHRFDQAAQVIVARWAEFRGIAVPDSLAGALAMGSPNQVYALIVNDNQEERRQALAIFRELRAAAGMARADLPGAAVGADFLTPEEYARLGFSAEALPAYLVVQNSSSGNPSQVVDHSLVRNCADPAFGAASLLRSYARAYNLDLKAPLPSSSFSQASALVVAARPLGGGQTEVTYSYALQGAFPSSAGTWVQEQRSVLDPNGQSVPQGRSLTDLRSQLEVSNSFTLSVAPGTYQLKLFLTDKRAGTSLTLENSFVVP